MTLYHGLKRIFLLCHWNAENRTKCGPSFTIYYRRVGKSNVSFVIIVISDVGIHWDISIYPCHKNLILGHKQNFLVVFEWLLVPNPGYNSLTSLWRCFWGVILNQWEMAERVQFYSIRYAYYDQWIYIYNRGWIQLPPVVSVWLVQQFYSYIYVCVICCFGV